MSQPSPSAYEMLLYVVQTARSIPNATKKSMLARIEANDWDDALRLQLRDLCATEALLRKKQAAELRASAADLKNVADRQLPEAEAEQEEVVADFNEENSAIVAAFKQEADSVERDLNRGMEQDKKAEEKTNIDALRSFLKQDADA